MQYGMYTAASGMLTSMYRMDVQANNLANVETVGFRVDSPSTKVRPVERDESGLRHLPSNKMLERLGGGVMLDATRISTAQGTLQRTGNTLDVALQGHGYLVIRDGQSKGPEALQFSRDGRLTLDRNGRLVQAASGQPVLDTSDRAITLLPDPPAEIDQQGNIRQGGELVAQIQVATIANPRDLRKRGDNMLAAAPEVMARKQPVTGTTFNQAHVERSTVDPVKAMMAISAAERGMSGGAKMIGIYNEILERTINTFGKLA